MARRSGDFGSRRIASSFRRRDEAQTSLLDLDPEEEENIFERPGLAQHSSGVGSSSSGFTGENVSFEPEQFSTIPLDDPEEITFRSPTKKPKQNRLELLRSSDDDDDDEKLEQTNLLSEGSSTWTSSKRSRKPLHADQFRRNINKSRSTASDISANKEKGYEMRSRTIATSGSDQSPNRLNPSFVLVDIPVEAQDTLPSFAIRYHVTIAELKRLNNLYSDQDFYSRQSLRVPIHKYGILAERFLPAGDRNDLLNSVNQASTSTAVLVDLDSHTNSPSEIERDDVALEDEDSVSHEISLRSVLNSQSREARLFLQNMDRDLSRLARETLQRGPVSPSLMEQQRVRVEPLDGLGCDGADFGIPVKVIIVMAIILVVVLPAAFLAYSFYCQKHPGVCSDSPIQKHFIPDHFTTDHSSSHH